MIVTSQVGLSSDLPWDIARATCTSLKASAKNQENTSVLFDFPLIFQERIQCPKQAIRAGCNTFNYSTCFLYSDWLYLLRYDIKKRSRHVNNGDNVCLL